METSMALSRRSFIRALGAGGLGLASPSVVSARGSEAWRGSGRQSAVVPGLVRLDSNENPAGPCVQAIEAMRGGFPDSSRYPDREADALADALAAFHGVP